MKGDNAKKLIYDKIISTFGGAQMCDKVVRIPMTEDGEVIEIEVKLTAKKDRILNAEPVDSPIPVQADDAPLYTNASQEEIQSARDMLERMFKLP